MKLILTDIDDTLLKFADHFQEWAEAEGHQTYGRLRDTGSIQMLLRYDRARVDDLVTEFSVKHLGDLHPEEDALEVIPELRKMGYEFVAISSCVDGPVMTKMRHDNLERVFGFPFRDVHCTGLMRPKEDFLKAHEPTWWIEDNPHHAHVGSGLGHISMLLDRPYNQAAEVEAIRVRDWYAIHGIIHTANTVNAAEERARSAYGNGAG